jgi:hypothetical protein
METAQATTTQRYVTASLRHFVTHDVTEADLPAEWTVEEATREISRAIGLPTVDMESRPAHYELFVRRSPDGEGEKLPSSGRIGELVREGDEIAPMPEITPGGRTHARCAALTEPATLPPSPGYDAG